MRKIFILLVLIFASICLMTFALAKADVQVGEELAVPNMESTINMTCTGHEHFQQASADIDGAFAILSNNRYPTSAEDIDSLSEEMYYIDFYTADGSFYKEFAFHTQQGIVMELQHNVIYVYFAKTVLTYDVYSDEIHCYQSVYDGLPNDLRASEFMVGKWTYQCKRGLLGYVRLIRMNENTVQTLVEMPGLSEQHRDSLIGWCIAMSVYILATAIVVVVIENARKNKKQMA